MSETMQAPTPKDVAEATIAGKAEQVTETPEQTIDGLRAALAKANREAKENRLKAEELDGIKQAQMSELEKAQQAAKDAGEKLATAERQVLRQKVALEKGLPVKWVSRLQGDTEDELSADADLILADLPGPQSSTTTPKPDLTQGGSSEPAALNSDGLEQALRSKLGI